MDLPRRWPQRRLSFAGICDASCDSWTPPRLWAFVLPCARWKSSDDEPLAARRVENMCSREIRRETNPVAGMAVGAIANRRRDLLAVETAVELRIRPGRLDNDHLDGDAARAEREVL